MKEGKSLSDLMGDADLLLNDKFLSIFQKLAKILFHSLHYQNRAKLSISEGAKELCK